MKTIVLTALSTVLLCSLAAGLFVLSGAGEKQIRQRVEPLYAVRDPQFRRAMGALLDAPIIGGNRVIDLQNGDQIFPQMLEAIRGARHSITFETYIYWSGEIGQAFADALSERARAGVPVHVLLDWLGSVKMEERFLRQMRDAGVQVQRFHKPRWFNLPHLNNRTHRKLLVVDGRIGFTGGVGIADQWQGHAQDPAHWRDAHFRLDGPAVAAMQAVFMDNWIKSTGQVLHGQAYFPALQPAGEVAAQVVSSSPTAGSDTVHLMYLMAIAAASESILLSSSYFVPDELAVQALAAAARRGVGVRIITPGPLIDTEVVRRASRARWGPLLEAGVQIHEFQPTMYHVKMMVVDRCWVSVGSTNFDNRSFRINDEANLNVYDERFARRAAEVFAADLARSRGVTLEQWQQRPWQEKLWERIASLAGGQL